MEETNIDEMASVSEDDASTDDVSVDTGRAARREITHKAQLNAIDAVSTVSIAMKADEAADKAMQKRIAADRAHNREQSKEYRKVEREARREANSAHKSATAHARRAYEAIKYSAPNKMGFMRVVQLGFVAHIFVTLITLLLESRDDVPLDATNLMSWVIVVLEGMAFWMFSNRYKIARPFVIGMSVAGLLMDLFVRLSTDSFSLLLLLKDGFYYVFLILYFLFSRRVKATLVNDISSYKPHEDGKEFVIERRGWPFYRNLVMYFVIFSVLGHWMEMAMCQLIIAGLVEGEYDPGNTMLWRDWLFPFPMEGAAVVIIALLLYPLYTWLKEKYGPGVLSHVLSFLANALTCSCIEFFSGLIYNNNYQLWDYRENFGNIMGQVCLQNALAFGVACSVIAWFVYPTLERWISSLPYDVVNIAFVATVVFGGIIWSLYIIESPFAQMEPISHEFSFSFGEDSISVDTSGNTQSSPQGLEVSVDTSLSTEDKLKALQQTAESLRSSLEQDQSLTDEERQTIESQLVAIEVAINTMTETYLADAA